MEMKSYGYFFIRLFVVSVGINYLWEMAQMPFYEGMSFQNLISWLLCFRASLGDGIIILAIWAAGFVVFRRIDWYRRINLKSVFVLVTSGVLIASVIEIHALKIGRWSYSPNMPLVSPWDVGLTPLLQLIVLPVLVMYIAGQWNRKKRATESEAH
jgi:hypothetical protein